MCGSDEHSDKLAKIILQINPKPFKNNFVTTVKLHQCRPNNDHTIHSLKRHKIFNSSLPYSNTDISPGFLRRRSVQMFGEISLGRLQIQSLHHHRGLRGLYQVLSRLLWLGQYSSPGALTPVGRRFISCGQKQKKYIVEPFNPDRFKFQILIPPPYPS